MKSAKQLGQKQRSQLASIALASSLAFGMAVVPGTSQAGWNDVFKEMGFWKEWTSNKKEIRKEWTSYRKENGCRGSSCLRTFVAELKAGGSMSAPELDPNEAGAALLLLAGASLVVATRRPRKTEQS